MAIVATALSLSCRRSPPHRVAVVCASIDSRTTQLDIDLGGGRRFVRRGVRAELRGFAPETRVAVTSLDGTGARPARSEKPSRDPFGVVVVVGLGALARDDLVRELQSIATSAAIVVVVAGPEDDVDEIRAAVASAGPRVLDGGEVRALVLDGLEVVAIPGGADPSMLPAHGRGCAVRPDDVRALSDGVGPAGGRVRVSVSYASPSRDRSAPTPVDLLVGTRVWLVAGPIDRIFPPRLAVSSDGPAIVGAIPRLHAPRTASTPAVLPAGVITLHTSGATGLEIAHEAGAL